MKPENANPHTCNRAYMIAKDFCSTDRCYFSKTRTCPASNGGYVPANWYCPVFAFLDYKRSRE